MARAASVSTLLAMAPGTQPTITMPVNVAPSNPNDRPTTKANTGMQRYWIAVPPKPFGQRRTTWRTSSRGSNEPMANIVAAISQSRYGLLRTNGSQKLGHQASQ